MVEEAVPRDYSTFVEQMGVKLHNCFIPRADVTVPHSFVYKRRMDLTSKEVAMLTGRQRDGHDRDVFGICKSRMSDAADQILKPVLVLPFDRAQLVGSIKDIPLSPRVPVTEGRAEQLNKLADILVGPPYNNTTGAETLRKLAAGQFQDEKIDLPFFEVEKEIVPMALPVDACEHFPHLPKVCRPMLARFSRAK